MLQSVLITGSSGLVGSECVRLFDRLGCRVIGVDSNQRQDFFGPDGDTAPTLRRLLAECENFKHIKADIRKRELVAQVVESAKPQLVIHCAAQPSHDLAAKRPFDDFDTNAVGTLNLLEATRQHVPGAVFVFASTNKVYGDAPNELDLVELETRWDFAEPDFAGINEETRIDASRHSLFGASKVAADILVQEYGRTFGMMTACFRCGCLTGSAHAGVEQHGFLAYMAKCKREGRKYTIFGYSGKQVRDNLHAADVATAFAEFWSNPKQAAVYNLGGGKANSVSVLEALERFGVSDFEYVDQPRGGDHIVYYTDLAKFTCDYPRWRVSRDLDSIFDEFTEVK